MAEGRTCSLTMAGPVRASSAGRQAMDPGSDCGGATNLDGRRARGTRLCSAMALHQPVSPASPLSRWTILESAAANEDEMTAWLETRSAVGRRACNVAANDRL